MSDIATLGIRVDSDGVATADGRLKELTQSGVQSEQSANAMTSAWNNFSVTLVTINQGIQLVSRVFGTLSRHVDTLTTAWRDNEQAAVRLESAWRAAGGASGLAIGEIQALNAELVNLTGIASQTVDEAAAMALTFHNIGENEFPRMMESAADLATIMGTDLVGGIQQVAFALNDPIQGVTRLRRSGIQLSETQQQLVKDFVAVGDMASAQGIILGELESQFGGAAQAMRDTARGSQMAWEEALNYLRSEVGRGIEDVLRPGREALTEWIMENAEVIGILAANIPEVLQISARAGLQVLDNLFSASTLEAIFSRIGTSVVAAMRAAARVTREIWGGLFDALVDTVRDLGPTMFQSFIDGLTRRFTGGSLPQFLKDILGIGDWQGIDVFGTESFSDQLEANLKKALGESVGAFSDYFTEIAEELGSLAIDVGDLLDFSGISTDAAEQIQRLIDRVKDGREELDRFIEFGDRPAITVTPADVTDNTAERFLENLTRTNAELEATARLGDAARAAIFDLQMGYANLNEEQKEQALTLNAENELYRERIARTQELTNIVNELREATTDPAEAVRNTMAMLKEARDAGMIDREENLRFYAYLRDQLHDLENAVHPLIASLDMYNEELRLTVEHGNDAEFAIAMYRAQVEGLTEAELELYAAKLKLNQELREAADLGGEGAERFLQNLERTKTELELTHRLGDRAADALFSLSMEHAGLNEEQRKQALGFRAWIQYYEEGIAKGNELQSLLSRLRQSDMDPAESIRNNIGMLREALDIGMIKPDEYLRLYAGLRDELEALENAVHPLIDTLDRQNEELRLTIEYGEGAEHAIAMYRAEVAGLTAEELEAYSVKLELNAERRNAISLTLEEAEAAERLKRAHEATVSFWKNEFMTEGERITKQMEDLKAAYDAGYFVDNVELFEKAWATLVERLDEFTFGISDAMEELNAMGRLADTVTNIAFDHMWRTVDLLVGSLRDLTSELLNATLAGGGFGNTFAEIAKSMLEMMPGVMLSIAQAMVTTNPALWPAALALIAYAGAINVGLGVADYIENKPNADGNVYNKQGHVTSYASGGIFGERTMFTYGGGKLGELGEAGPEAIMPLSRDSSGRLGVEASGASVTNVYIQNYTGADVERRETVSPNGDRELFIVVGKAVSGAIESGTADKAMFRRYGISGRTR